MPRVKIDYIVSFSSEDEENQANNLLSWEINKKKWLCKEGEPSCSVVLQLAKAIQIESVNIGVHHAALVEVLVGLSEKPNDPFEVLVPSCVFVSAGDSRRGDAVERVRSFSGAQLADASARRWDRVRVVCTQPYNKRVKYGLSFVHLYSAESGPEPEPAVPAAPVAPVARALSLDLDTYSSDENEFRPGELFAQRNVANTNTDAQIRQASSQALNNNSDASTKLIKTPIAKNNSSRQGGRPQTHRQRDSILYTADDDRPHDRIDRLVRSHNEEKSERGKKRGCDSQDGPAKRERLDKPTEKTEDGNRQRANTERAKEAAVKRDRTDTRQTETNRTQERDKKQDVTKRSADKPKGNPTVGGPVLSGVVFSMSGYENPRRARVRDAAVALGARFEHALQRCTHLVCAFPNTPKMRELQRVAPTAVAVMAEWVEHCAVAARRLPTPPYAPGRPVPSPPSPARPEHDSDADTDDEIERATRDAGLESDEVDATPGTSVASGSGISVGGTSGSSTLVGGASGSRAGGGTSGSDTECDEPDEGAERRGSNEEGGGLSGSDTEIDEPPPRCREPKTLPAMFDGSQFALDPRLPPDTLALLSRYLLAYGALVVRTDELDEDSAVDYVVSEQGDARGVPGAAGVTPSWVWRCHRQGSLSTR